MNVHNQILIHAIFALLDQKVAPWIGKIVLLTLTDGKMDLPCRCNFTATTGPSIHGVAKCPELRRSSVSFPNTNQSNSVSVLVAQWSVAVDYSFFHQLNGCDPGTQTEAVSSWVSRSPPETPSGLQYSLGA
jgi:hypothetical protein